ncbi:hypothetical protein PM3016_6705 [Paenibacillus mucilaginosus 3016]|uniref:Uncharacterized protein n=1 Tax=Paenibacillus mucilaginosus 3016 TaxID=1116391 RepID=H6NNJ2_9BACL|nr:hypothetical protein [Paenibacillus mucilaginosus]AFC33313.1 hypothetical protein PM3016_6705 [Paenibacillus mucilaginosus 3016]WFA22788.1 hypothetical protein ERY13_33300 [Paenibacillus mucilaginosus]
MDFVRDLHKLIKLTGDRARLDARANGTYIVYKTANGEIVKEYDNGEIEPIKIRRTRMSDLAILMF